MHLEVPGHASSRVSENEQAGQWSYRTGWSAPAAHSAAITCLVHPGPNLGHPHAGDFGASLGSWVNLWWLVQLLHGDTARGSSGKPALRVFVSFRRSISSPRRRLQFTARFWADGATAGTGRHNMGWLSAAPSVHQSQPDRLARRSLCRGAVRPCSAEPPSASAVTAYRSVRPRPR